METHECCIMITYWYLKVQWKTAVFLSCTEAALNKQSCNVHDCSWTMQQKLLLYLLNYCHLSSTFGCQLFAVWINSPELLL